MTRCCAPAARPTAPSSYFLAQTLVGAWPIELERMQAYIDQGAARGQAHHQLDRARRGVGGGGHPVLRRGVYADPTVRFALEAFVGELQFSGDRIALGTVALKLTGPGDPRHLPGR